MTRADAETLLQNARRAGEEAYVMAVADVWEAAADLARSGRETQACDLYRVIAVLEIEDRRIEPAVDEARRVLEGHGLESPPSIQTDYQRYLQGLAPLQRHLLLARQCVRELASAPDATRAAALRNEALEHFEAARSHGVLSKKDERVYLGLRKSSPTRA